MDSTPVSRADLVKFLSGTLDNEELKGHILQEADIEGSFVHSWLAEMERKGRNPLENIDWSYLADSAPERSELDKPRDVQPVESSTSLVELPRSQTIVKLEEGLRETGLGDVIVVQRLEFLNLSTTLSNAKRNVRSWAVGALLGVVTASVAGFLAYRANQRADTLAEVTLELAEPAALMPVFQIQSQTDDPAWYYRAANDESAPLYVSFVNSESSRASAWKTVTNANPQTTVTDGVVVTSQVPWTTTAQTGVLVAIDVELKGTLFLRQVDDGRLIIGSINVDGTSSRIDSDGKPPESRPEHAVASRETGPRLELQIACLRLIEILLRDVDVEQEGAITALARVNDAVGMASRNDGYYAKEMLDTALPTHRVELNPGLVLGVVGQDDKSKQRVPPSIEIRFDPDKPDRGREPTNAD